MTLPHHVEDMLDRQMDRKEFLRQLAVLGVAVFGGELLVKFLFRNQLGGLARSNHAYGAGTYGGDAAVPPARKLRVTGQFGLLTVLCALCLFCAPVQASAQESLTISETARSMSVDPGGAFTFMLEACLYIGLIGSLPVIIYQLYRFVMPAVKTVALKKCCNTRSHLLCSPV